MGWENPAIPWRDFEQRLSWGRHGELTPPPRPIPLLPAEPPPGPVVPYAELHAHSAYSFLDGVSSPAELHTEAARLGLRGLALVDHDGFYGVAQHSEAAEISKVRALFGAELSVDLTVPRAGTADPEGGHLLALARDPEGYRRLSSAIGAAQMAGGSKGRPSYDLTTLSEAGYGHWVVLTGCRKGSVRSALTRYGLGEDGLRAAEVELRTLIDMFGRDAVYVELIDHDRPLDDPTNTVLAEIARRTGLPTVATNNVHYARPTDHWVANAVAALRARRTLDEMDGWLGAAPTAHLRSGAEMAARFARFPGAVERSVEIADRCAFAFDTIKPHLPDFPVPDGHTEATHLRELVWAGAAERYGPREENQDAYRQLEHELAVIEEREFPGYFLIVHSITEFCHASGILCQGRGSATNSAVCYALRITNVDPMEHHLLFERFLSPVRDGYPDIDVDIEAKRRERVIQHVYEKYGRDRAAQVANVITYRDRMALRDAARVLGYPQGTCDAWSRRIGPHDPLPESNTDIPDLVLELAARLRGLPRHLGIHSGGMVIVDRPVSQVVPTEWASMADRSVLQWDKDDCADADLVKFDLLGLGMLGALHDAFDLVRQHHGVTISLQDIPQRDTAVYDMLCDADSVGVFQVESRAQMATLPRLRPQKFYDLVVEVAIIRPGPIQGGAVHPYLRRRDGNESPDPPHPVLEDVLRRTLGVPLFQEQVMQMAIAAAGFTATDADRLRRAMSAKRSIARMEELRERLMKGMAERDIPEDVAEDIYGKLQAFANFGFPESHSISMAYLVWCSAYLKRYFPAAFTTALLRNQPMGFYSPASLIADARRHDVTIRRADVNASDALAVIEPLGDDETYTPTHRFASPHRQPAIRLGLSTVRHVGSAAETIVTERAERGPYTDLEDFVRRTGLPARALESLAAAGAFGSLGYSRRRALWTVGALAGIRDDQLPGTTPGTQTPELPAMTGVEQTFADLWTTGVTPENHPVSHLRPYFDAVGITAAARLGETEEGADEGTGRRPSPARRRKETRGSSATRRVVRVAGLVTHRQRPPTAGGVCFLSLEDETGLANVICPPGVWKRYKRVAMDNAALIVQGTLERDGRVTNLVATRIHPLRLAVPHRSRDFR